MRAKDTDKEETDKAEHDADQTDEFPRVDVEDALVRYFVLLLLELVHQTFELELPPKVHVVLIKVLHLENNYKILKYSLWL